MTDYDAISIYAVLNLLLWQYAMRVFFNDDDDRR